MSLPWRVLQYWFCCMIIIPFLKVTSGPHQLVENKFGDICDGTVYADYPIFSQNQQAIQIVAYFDEMETANALGAKAAKNNKLGIIISKFYSSAIRLQPHRCSLLLYCQLRATYEIQVK